MDAAENITTLIEELKQNGNANIDAVCNEDTPLYLADQWNSFDRKIKREFSPKLSHSLPR